MTQETRLIFFIAFFVAIATVVVGLKEMIQEHLSRGDDEPDTRP